MKRILFLAILLFAILFRSGADNLDLTLIPPSKVSDKVELDIRAGMNNNSDKERYFRVTISLRKGLDSRTLCQIDTLIHAKQNIILRHNVNTDGMMGEYSVVLKVRNGIKVYKTSRKIEIIPSEKRSLGTIDGAWIGLYHWSDLEGKHWNDDIRKLTAEDWRGVVRSMHEVGMDVIVIQELFRNQFYVGQHDITADSFDGRAFYPSALYQGRMDVACDDPLEAIMSEADRLGMNVLPGIGLFAWFDFSAESLEWHKRVTKEVYDRYGHHSSFYGFYVSEECYGSLDNVEPTEELRTLRREEIVSFFREYKRFCSELAPAKPIMLATNSMQVADAGETYARLLENMDILCPFGFARMPENDLTGYEAAKLLQQWCDDAGSHLWFDLEAFLFNEDGSLFPRDIDGIIADLTEFDNFEKILCYQYPGVFNNPEMHPVIGEDRSVRLYEKYRQYLSPVNELSLTLTPPASVTDKVDVDIQAGIVNNSKKASRCKVKIYLQSSTDRALLKKDIVLLSPKESYLLTETIDTEGLEGKYEVVFKVQKGLRKQTVIRPIEVIPYESNSYEMLNGTWTGSVALPDFTEKDWTGVVRSMHHIGMDMVLVSDGLAELNGNDAISYMMKEADRVGMYVVHEVTCHDADISAALTDALNIIRLHGHHKSFYGLCLSGDISGIDKFIEKVKALVPAVQIVVSTDRINAESIESLSNADVIISYHDDCDIIVSENRHWLTIPTNNLSNVDITGTTILSHMKDVGMLNIEGLKEILLTNNSFAKTIFGEYLGKIDNPSLHLLVGGQESLDLNVSYTAYSMYKEWLKPYSVPPGAEIVRNPKGILKEGARRIDCVTVEINQAGDPRIQERHWQAVPSIAAEKDGKVIYQAWNAGGRDEEMGNYITLSVSEDRGETWKHDVLVVYPNNPVNTRILDAVLWRDENNEIYLKFTVTISDYGDQIDPMTSSHQMKVGWNGKEITYTDPIFLTYGLMINPPTFIKGKNLSLYPICRCSMNHLNRMRYKKNPEKGTYAYSMKNDKFSLYSIMPEVDYSLYDFEEQQFLCLDEDGKNLMCISRYRGGTRKSYSNDYGRSWTDFETMPEIGSSTSSKACIQKLNSGRVMLIYNNAEDRSMMTVAISEDNGKSWPYKMVVDERPLTSYPAASQTADGTIYMTYDRDRYHDMDIHVLRFTEDEIISGDASDIFRINLTQVQE